MAVTFFSEQTVHELLCLGLVVQLEGEPGMVAFGMGDCPMVYAKHIHFQ